jgi:hypothetical protein
MQHCDVTSDGIRFADALRRNANVRRPNTD